MGLSSNKTMSKSCVKGCSTLSRGRKYYEMSIIASGRVILGPSSRQNQDGAGLSNNMAGVGCGSSHQNTANNSPLLPSFRKAPAHEGSSLSGSFECPKSYGSTTNPIKSGVNTKLVGHVLEPGDTLQGLAIKYGVPMVEIRRVNKLWANDNLHLYKVIKIPVKSNSEFADLDDVEMNCDDMPPTAPLPSVSQDKEDCDVEEGQEFAEGQACSSHDNHNELKKDNEKKMGADLVSSFLSRLDSQIMNEVKKSEKLRKQSGPEVIQSVERCNPGTSSSEENLFRPLSLRRDRRNQDTVTATSGRFVNRARSKLHSAEDQFFEL